MFVGELVESVGPALLDRLENEHTDYEFTVFAVRNKGFASGPRSLQGHIIDRRIEGKELFGGGLMVKTKSALSKEDVVLHVGRGKNKVDLILVKTS